MERVDHAHRATMVDEPGPRLRGAVIAERRIIAATVVDTLPPAEQKRPRTPPAPPPRPEVSRSDAEASELEHDLGDPLQELAGG